MVPEQRLLPRDARRANLAVPAFRVLFVVPKDAVRHILLRFMVLESVFLHYLQPLVAIPRFGCLLDLLPDLLLLRVALVLHDRLLRKLLTFRRLVLVSIERWVKVHRVRRDAVVVINVFVHRIVASWLILPMKGLSGIEVDCIRVLLAVRRQVRRGIRALLVIVRFH